MDGMTENERAIAWLWAIEALASFKEVDAKLLHDMIEMAPALPDDMGKNAKERVALRCLEGFFGPCDAMNTDVSSAQHSKFSFDLSESCENVLKRVVDETPETDLRTAGPGLLKWDIHPFIVHKRASLPKCALKQLKESILDGTHPHADFLRKKSGLTLRSNGDSVPVSDSNRRLKESCSNAQNMGVEGNTNPAILDNGSKLLEEDPCNTNLLPSKTDRIVSDAENIADETRKDSCVDEGKDDGRLHPEPRISGVTPSDGTQNKVSAQVFNCNSEHDYHIKAPHPASADGLQKKRISEEGNALDKQNLAGENHKSATDSDDCGVNAKKIKWDASYVLQAIEQNQLSLHGSESLEESSGRDVSLSQRGRCDLAENEMGMMDKGKALEDGHNDYSASKRCEQSTIDAIRDSLPDTFQDEAHENTCADEAKDDGGFHSQPIVSCVAASAETQLEVSAKVLHCNNEQGHIKVQHPAAADEPQQKSVADEGKDNSEHCPEPKTSGIAPLDETQHKDSAKGSGSSSEHDSQIKVAHPASADGSQQKSIGDEAKELVDWLCHYESETSADSDGFHDEKIDIAMTKHAFLSSQCASSHNSSPTTGLIEKNLCKKCEGGQFLVCNTSNCPVEVREDWLPSSANLYEKDNVFCPFCSYSLTLTKYLESKKEISLLKKDLNAFIHTLEHQPKERLGRLHNEKNSCTRKFDKDLNGKNHPNGNWGEREKNTGKECEENANEVNDLQFQNIIGNEQEVAPSASCVHVNSECRDESATVVRRKVDVSTGEKEGEEKVVQACVSQGGLDACHNRVPAKGDNLSSKNKESLLVHKGPADVVSDQEDLQQHITNAPEEQGHEHNIDSERNDDKKSSTSNYSLRLRRRKPPNIYPATPQLRRTMIPWSVEEEEMLKKGVLTFSRINENIPWKQILEFGGSVFLHSRTSVDLKDKWRNLCRGNPKLNEVVMNDRSREGKSSSSAG